MIETATGSPPALPVQHQVGEHAVQRVPIPNALAGLGEFEDPAGHGRARDRRHFRRQLRCRGHAESLAQHAVGRVEQILGQRLDIVRQAHRVRGQGDAALIDAHRKPESTLNAVVPGREVREAHRPGALGADVEFGRRRLARENGSQWHRCVALQHPAAETGGGKTYAHVVGGTRGGVEHRGKRVIGFSRPDGSWMGKGQRKLGIAHQHRAGGLASDGDRAGGEAVEFGGQGQVHDVQALLQSLDQEFALPGVARVKPPNIVGGANHTVGPGPSDCLRGLNNSVRAEASEPQWIVTRLVIIGARDLVWPGRQV